MRTVNGNEKGVQAMIFVLHGEKDKCVWDNFHGAIKPLVHDSEIEILRSKECLAERLSQVTCVNAIVVLITTDRQELMYLLSIVGLLRRTRVIVVIPNQEPETIRIGYKLEPRFLSSGTENLSEILAVLQNMLEE